jgi:hypothetical protein
MKKLGCAVVLSAVACVAIGCSSSTGDDEPVSASESELGTIVYEHVTCESWDGRYHTCDVQLNGGRILDVRVVREYSSSRCNQGSTFGTGLDYVWVNRGCEADFRVRIEQRPQGATCACAAYAKLYDDTCGAGCGLISTYRDNDRRDGVPNTRECYDQCVDFMTQTGHDACRGNPGARSVRIGGTWNWNSGGNSSFPENQYRCVDL